MIYKCKSCGGGLEVTDGATVVECEYCGLNQTIPTAKDENLQNLFNRANAMRLKCEFDKAEKLYEKIVQADETQAEAYWGLILCKYGIEYVEDPKTYRRVPTCHRASYDAVTTDENYKLAMQYADVVQKAEYEREAKEIDEIQKGILAIAQTEEPYDVFICYKETDETGRRTQDSVIANDIYHQLTQEGLKVFYAAITLEDKLGSAYEPIIFAALHSAKVMLALGTKPEYFNAVWVKNEWSRFLKIMQGDKNKLLIPCYRDMDAYELPEEFAHLQAQDMGKIGFIADLVRGIQKIVPAKTGNTGAEKTTATTGNATALNFLKRANLALENEEFESAKTFAEQALNIDAECAEAYLIELLCAYKKTKAEDLALGFDYRGNTSYKRLMKFANAELRAKMEAVEKSYLDRLERERLERERREAEERERLEKERLAAEAERLANIQRLKQKREEIKKVNAVAFAGDYHTVGLKSDGTVVAIGNNKYVQCNVSEWRDIVAIAAVDKHTVGLKSDGTVVAVGENRGGQCNVSEWKDIAAISAGDWHTVGLKSDGTVVAVGRKVDGQCDVSNWRDIVAIAVGDDHTVGLKSDGTVVAVGSNTDILKRYCNQCGVSGWRDIVAIAAGEYHTVGLKSDGMVVAVGKNEYGQCNVREWRDIVAIAAGDEHTVGLKSDGTVVAVGKNIYGNCNVSAWRDIVAIAAGKNHTVGLKSDGMVVAVGENEDGQCNVSDWKLFNNFDNLEKERLERKRKAEEERQANIQRLKPIREKLKKAQGLISVGIYHAIGLKNDGTVVAVGNNTTLDYKDGQVVEKPCGQCNVSEWREIVSVSVSEEHTVGLKKDGTVVAVGKNGDGQCNVSEWRDIVAIAAWEYHTVGVKRDGTVVAIGKNNGGQCNVLPWRDIVAVSTGWEHTVGLKSDGTVVAVGDNENGRCEVGEWRDIVAIAAGAAHTVGLKSDGTVVAVGDDKIGQCNVSNWRDIVAVSAGLSHTVGLKSDGTVVSVGENIYGNCNVSEWRDIVAVSAGSSYTFGLKSDGTVVAVGNNYRGLCNVQGWKLFNDFDNLEEERKVEMEKAGRRAEKVCQHCGGTFKGLFSKTCSVCGKPKDY